MLRRTVPTVLAVLAGSCAAWLASSAEPPVTALPPAAPPRAAAPRQPRSSPVAAPRTEVAPAARETAARAPDDAAVDAPVVEVSVLDGESGALLDVRADVATAPRPGVSQQLDLRVDVPGGMLPALHTTLAPWAGLRRDVHTVRARVVLVPAVRVVLRPDTRFRGRVREGKLWLAGRGWPPAGRRPLVFEIPRHAGTPLRAAIATAAQEGCADAVVAPDATRILIDVPLPGDEGRTVGVACRGAPSGSVAPNGTGRLVVVVRDADGRPAANAVVALDGTTESGSCVLERARTGADGSAVLQDLPALRGTLAVSRRSGLPSLVDVELGDGDDATLAVDAPAPTSVCVRVADAQGRPVPCAAVTPRFSGRVLPSVDGGVLDATPLTDAAGTCILRGMPPRGLEIDVAWGWQKVRAHEAAPGRWEAVLRP